MGVQGSFGEVSGKFRGSFGKVSGKFRGSFGEVSGKFRGSFGEVSGEFRGSYAGFRGTQTKFPTRNPGDLHWGTILSKSEERMRGKVAKSTRNMVFMDRDVLLGFFAGRRQVLTRKLAQSTDGRANLRNSSGQVLIQVWIRTQASH